MISSLISLALLVLVIIAKWKVFEKAGQPGWKCLIPFYNIYVQGSFVFVNKTKAIIYIVLYAAFFVLYGITFGTAIASGNGTLVTTSSSISYSTTDVNPVLALLSFAVAIATFVYAIMFQIATAKSFGKGGGFAAGLIFLGFIFYPILGFSKDIYYIGPEGNPANGYNPYGQPMPGQQPYGQPPMPQDPYAAQQQNPYAAQQTPQQDPYAAQSNPYAAQQQPYAQPQPQQQQPNLQINPYASQQQQPAQNPYAAPQQNPYAAQPEQNPYAARQQPTQQPYMPDQQQPYAPDQQNQNPYTTWPPQQ